MSYKKIILIGNLGKAVELRYTPQGIAVGSSSMAVNEKRRGKDGEFQDVTTWFKLTFWRQNAENAAKFLTKGSQLYVEGNLNIEEWTDKDSNNRYTLDVQVSEMRFIGTKGEGENAQLPEGTPTHTGKTPDVDPQADAVTTTAAPKPVDDDDIPF